MKRDLVFDSFLEQQLVEAGRLATSSDLVRVLSIDPQHYVLRFLCRGLVAGPAGPVPHDDFGVGIFFRPDHVRVEQHPSHVIQWLGPDTVWHPNIRTPFVCTGSIAAGEGLIDLTYRLFEIITFHKVSPHHALNPMASQWVRHHLHELPLDRRPLMRPLGPSPTQARLFAESDGPRRSTFPCGGRAEGGAP